MAENKGFLTIKSFLENVDNEEINFKEMIKEIYHVVVNK